MRSNYIHFGSPQFRILSDKQIEELHFATLQIMERIGILFECQEAIDILGEAGADVSDPGRVKIPSYLVEQALKDSAATSKYAIAGAWSARIPPASWRGLVD